MQVKTLTDDLGLPVGTELTVDDATGNQWIGWHLVEEVAAAEAEAAKAAEAPKTAPKAATATATKAE